MSLRLASRAFGQHPMDRARRQTWCGAYRSPSLVLLRFRPPACRLRPVELDSRCVAFGRDASANNNSHPLKHPMHRYCVGALVGDDAVP